MTVIVWYNETLDEIFENVKSISSLKSMAVQISFVRNGVMQNKVIYLDGNTSITIDSNKEE